MAGLRQWLTAVVAVALAAGCEGPPGAPSAPGAPPPASASAGAAGNAAEAPGLASASPAASAVTEVLRAVRARLDVEPAPAPPQQLALTRRRLARLGPGGLTLVALPAGTEEAHLPLSEARRVLALGDDALVVATRAATLLLPGGARTAREFPRVTLFPGGFLLPWRGERHRAWVAPGLGDALLPWAAVEAELPAELRLDGHRGGALTALADGSLLAAVEGGLLRVHPLRPASSSAATSPGAGRQARLVTPRELGVPWRLLPARRADRVWWVEATGRVALVELGADAAAGRLGGRSGALRVVRTLRLEGTPSDAASAAERLAVVTVVAPSGEGSDGGAPGAGRRWRVTVLDERGEERFGSALPADPPLDDERWAGQVVRDREVVLDAEARFLAVGGPRAVTVWELRDGRQRFTAGAAR